MTIHKGGKSTSYINPKIIKLRLADELEVMFDQIELVEMLRVDDTLLKCQYKNLGCLYPDYLQTAFLELSDDGTALKRIAF